jgi:hypothetical protein
VDTNHSTLEPLYPTSALKTMLPWRRTSPPLSSDPVDPDLRFFPSCPDYEMEIDSNKEFLDDAFMDGIDAIN